MNFCKDLARSWEYLNLHSKYNSAPSSPLHFPPLLSTCTSPSSFNHTHTPTPPQTYYHVPMDWLTADGSANQLVVFDALGVTNLNAVKLVTSTVKTTDGPALSDEVDSHDMCLTV